MSSAWVKCEVHTDAGHPRSGNPPFSGSPTFSHGTAQGPQHSAYGATEDSSSEHVRSPPEPGSGLAGS